MGTYILFLFMIIGFFIAKFFSGKKSGEQGILKSIKYKTQNYTFHFHHWAISLTIIIILFILNFYNEFIYGFLIGLIIQGLTYKDFYKIIYKNIYTK